MKSVAILICTFACAYAGVPVVDPAATVLRSSFNIVPEGGYQYGYETDNGISANVQANVKSVGKDETTLEVVGSNQFVAPDGQTYETSYIANENGYQPQGAHLPTPPAPEPIPDYILRALEFIKAHPYKEEVKPGKL